MVEYQFLQIFNKSLIIHALHLYNMSSSEESEKSLQMQENNLGNDNLRNDNQGMDIISIVQSFLSDSRIQL